MIASLAFNLTATNKSMYNSIVVWYVVVPLDWIACHWKLRWPIKVSGYFYSVWYIYMENSYTPIMSLTGANYVINYNKCVHALGKIICNMDEETPLLFWIQLKQNISEHTPTCFSSDCMQFGKSFLNWLISSVWCWVFFIFKKKISSCGYERAPWKKYSYKKLSTNTKQYLQ